MRVEKSLRYILAGACMSLSLAAFAPIVHAQAGAGGASAAGSATRGSGPTGNNGVATTSPSTLGGSVSGSTDSPAVPGSTAGDTAVHNGPMAGNMTSTNPSTNAMNPGAYGNNRHANTRANREVQRRERRHAMNHHHRAYESSSTTTTTESE